MKEAPRVVTEREAIRFLEAHGFIAKGKQKGPHQKFWNPDTNRTTQVPRHKGDLPSGTWRAILQQSGVSAEEVAKHFGR